MDRIITWIAFQFALLCLCLLVRKDWRRWFGNNPDVRATVVGYRSRLRRGREHAMPIYRFSAEGREWDVVDMVTGPKGPPEIGSVRRLTFPRGHPDLARPPRPWTWAMAYLAVLYIAGVTGGLLLGLIEK